MTGNSSRKRVSHIFRFCFIALRLGLIMLFADCCFFVFAHKIQLSSVAVIPYAFIVSFTCARTGGLQPPLEYVYLSRSLHFFPRKTPCYGRCRLHCQRWRSIKYIHTYIGTMTLRSFNFSITTLWSWWQSMTVEPRWFTKRDSWESAVIFSAKFTPLFPPLDYLSQTFWWYLIP